MTPSSCAYLIVIASFLLWTTPLDASSTATTVGGRWTRTAPTSKINMQPPTVLPNPVQMNGARKSQLSVLGGNGVLASPVGSAVNGLRSSLVLGGGGSHRPSQVAIPLMAAAGGTSGGGRRSAWVVSSASGSHAASPIVPTTGVHLASPLAMVAAGNRASQMIAPTASGNRASQVIAPTVTGNRNSRASLFLATGGNRNSQVIASAHHGTAGLSHQLASQGVTAGVLGASGNARPSHMAAPTTASRASQGGAGNSVQAANKPKSQVNMVPPLAAGQAVPPNHGYPDTRPSAVLNAHASPESLAALGQGSHAVQGAVRLDVPAGMPIVDYMQRLEREHPSIYHAIPDAQFNQLQSMARRQHAAAAQQGGVGGMQYQQRESELMRQLGIDPNHPDAAFLLQEARQNGQLNGAQLQQRQQCDPFMNNNAYGGNLYGNDIYGGNLYGGANVYGGANMYGAGRMATPNMNCVTGDNFGAVLGVTAFSSAVQLFPGVVQALSQHSQLKAQMQRDEASLKSQQAVEKNKVEMGLALAFAQAAQNSNGAAGAMPTNTASVAAGYGGMPIGGNRFSAGADLYGGSEATMARNLYGAGGVDTGMPSDAAVNGSPSSWDALSNPSGMSPFANPIAT